MYYLYIIQNKEANYYTGTTNNLKRRLKEHNKGKSIATKNRGPWKLVYSEKFKTRSAAMKREYYIKSQKSRAFISKLIKSRNY